jgi:hypothetical protein
VVLHLELELDDITGSGNDCVRGEHESGASTDDDGVRNGRAGAGAGVGGSSGSGSWESISETWIGCVRPHVQAGVLLYGVVVVYVVV